MGLSSNGGTPKSSIFRLYFPLSTIQLLGYPHGYGNLHMIEDTESSEVKVILSWVWLRLP